MKILLILGHQPHRQLLPRSGRCGHRRTPRRRPSSHRPRPLPGTLRSDPAGKRDRQGRGLDPVVQRHCREVADADGYVVVHPNWWGQPPAVLKGWLDRVFRQGVSTSSVRRAWLGSWRASGRRLNHLEHAARRRIAALRRSAGEPLEGVRFQFLRRRRFPPPQLRVDHSQHAPARAGGWWRPAMRSASGFRAAEPASDTKRRLEVDRKDAKDAKRSPAARSARVQQRNMPHHPAGLRRLVVNPSGTRYAPVTKKPCRGCCDRVFKAPCSQPSL